MPEKKAKAIYKQITETVNFEEKNVKREKWGNTSTWRIQR